jgi:hypothetical protein
MQRQRRRDYQCNQKYQQNQHHWAVKEREAAWERKAATRLKIAKNATCLCSIKMASPPQPKTSKTQRICSDLYRASLGSGAKSVADADLERFAAETLAKEARQRQQRYDFVGLDAFISSPSSRLVLFCKRKKA